MKNFPGYFSRDDLNYDNVSLVLCSGRVFFLNFLSVLYAIKDYVTYEKVDLVSIELETVTDTL